MTREKFIKLSGWSMILGPFLFIIGLLAGSRPDYSPYNYASLPIDRYANLAVVPLSIVGLIFMSLGLIGMLVRYGARAGRSALWLGLSAVCGLVSASGVIGLAVYDREPWWTIFFLGLAAQFFSLAVFGIACLRSHVLPRWNALPLLSGLWVPGFMVLLGLARLETGTWLDSPEAAVTSLAMFGLLMFAVLGYLLQSDHAGENPIRA